MSYYLAPSLVRYRAEVNALWPQRDKASDGWIGDPAHSSRVSDHNPDPFGVVRAFDTDEDLDSDPADSGWDAWVIAERLRESRDSRIKYVIYEARMFSSYNHTAGPAWQWRPYSGTNLHRKHIHLSILPSIEAASDTRPWLTTLEEEMPLNDNDLAKVRAVVKDVMDEGTGDGQLGWGNTSKATLAGVQGLHNLVREQAMFMSDRIQVVQDKIDTLVDRLAEEIADRIVGAVPVGTVDIDQLRHHFRVDVSEVFREILIDAATPDVNTTERPSEQAMRESEGE